MKIYCYKYTYAPSTPRNECYPFSSYESEVSPALDLLPHLIYMSPLKHQAIFNSEIKTSTIRYEAASINLELFPSYDINQFFFPSSPVNLDNIIYIFEFILDTGEKVFTGFANYENISREYNLPNYGHIKIEIQGMEKAFKDYFSHRLLPSNDPLFHVSHGAQPTWWFNTYQCFEDRIHATCLRDNIFWDSLFAPHISTSTPPTNFPSYDSMFRYVNCVPQLYSDTWEQHIPQHTWWIKSGYNRFYALQYNCYELLEKACNAHGWKWYISPLSPNQYKLCIRDISENPPLEHTINEKLIKSYTESTWQYRFLYDYIRIPDGSSTMPNNGHSGHHFKIISNMLPEMLNQSNFFESARLYTLNNETAYTLDHWLDLSKKYTLENAFDANSQIFSYWRIKYNDNHFLNRTLVADRFKNDFILSLDAGSHEDLTTVCDLNNRNNYNFDTYYQPKDRDLKFTGNVGDMFFQWNPTHPQGAIEHHCDYNDYSQLPLFYQNFKNLLYSREKKIYELDLNYLIPYPDTLIHFRSLDYSILSLEPDLFHQTTKISIIQI